MTKCANRHEAIEHADGHGCPACGYLDVLEGTNRRHRELELAVHEAEDRAEARHSAARVSAEAAADGHRKQSEIHERANGTLSEELDHARMREEQLRFDLIAATANGQRLAGELASAKDGSSELLRKLEGMRSTLAGVLAERDDIARRLEDALGTIRSTQVERDAANVAMIRWADRAEKAEGALAIAMAGRPGISDGAPGEPPIPIE